MHLHMCLQYKMLWHVGPRVLFLELPFWQAMQHYMVYISFLSSGCSASPLCISSWISLPLRIDTKDQMLLILSFLVSDFQHGYQEVSGVVSHSSLVINHLLSATYSHEAVPSLASLEWNTLTQWRYSSHGLW
jgi:hypothetical protein